MTLLAKRAQSVLEMDALVAHMRQVGRCESALRELHLMWRLIESSAKMNCSQEAYALLPMMAATRERFERLERELVQSMVEETVKGVSAGLRSQALNLIDTLVRNLYERTADVGFLASDLLLCRCVAGLEADATAVVQHLHSYRSKYSVYRDIVVVDAHGCVQASTLKSETGGVRVCQDPLLARAMQTSGYVQSFDVTDVVPGHGARLMYAHRMLHPVSGKPVGVLCLCFDFDGEMQGLWDRADAAHRHSTLPAPVSVSLLLDAQGKVLASSDVHWIGVNEFVKNHQDGAAALCLHAGRTYVVQSAGSAGYQGYGGPPGWRVQIMTPVELAFARSSEWGQDGLDETVAQGLLAHASRFCPPLHAIHGAADAIRRVVWNGRVMTAGKQVVSERLRAVLEQIGETGGRTNEVFSQSLDALYGTVLSTTVRDSRLLTRLLTDLLDRNLYERANDCRWWALTPCLSALLEALVAGRGADEQVQAACRQLTAIHDLYTVYQHIVVYDAAGTIVAASQRDPQDGAPELLGTCIDSESLCKVLALEDAQAYYASPWGVWMGREVDGSTYVYHAAIRAADGAVLGGIGLVFHAPRELQAMLAGVQDAQDSGMECRQLAYVSRSGMVMAASGSKLQPGAWLDLPFEMRALPSGKSMACVMPYQGQYCVVAVTASSGYREFKRSDGEEVLALSIQAFGAVQDDAEDAVWRRRIRVHSLPATRGTSAQCVEMATFFVGRSVLAVDAACVLEAQSLSDVAPVSAGRLPYCIGTLARRSHGAVAGYVWVFDLGALLFGAPLSRTAQSQVIVLEYDGVKLGLLVSDLEGVAHFEKGQLLPAPALAGAGHALVDRLIRANDGHLLIQCLNVAALLRRLQVQQPAALYREG